MNSTNMPANLLTQSLNVEQQLQGGRHYSPAQYYNTVMVQPHADQMPYQICCTDYLQSVPSWLPYSGLHHYDHFMSQWFHNSQGMVYHPAYPYYGYQTSVETSQQVDDPTSFHYQTFPQPNFAPDQGIDDVSMVTSFVEIPPLAATHTGGLDPAYNLYTSAQVPAHLTNQDLQSFGDGVPTLPEVTYLEDISEIYQPPVEPEFGDTCADTGSMRFHPLAIEDHSSDQVYLEACTEPFPERAESCYGPVYSTEASAAMDFFYAMDNYGELSLPNPDFQDWNNWSGSVYPTFPKVTSLDGKIRFFPYEPEICQPPIGPEFEEASVDTGLVRVKSYQAKTDFKAFNKWSDSVDPTCPEVTSLENTTEFFQHEPKISEIYLPPPEPEFGETSADTGSVRVPPIMTQDHSSDYVHLVDCTEHFPERVEFCDGPVSTTEAAPTHYDQPCHAKPDFDQCDPEIPQPPVEKSELVEANADTGSLRVYRTETQDYP